MLVGILCRICRCLAVGPRERERHREGVVDDLTAIRGIGIAVKNRLNRAGITT